MKKFISLFSFAALFLLSTAFTSAEIATPSAALDNPETQELFSCTGAIKANAICVGVSSNRVAIRSFPSGAVVYSGPADGSSSGLLTLATGFYYVTLTSTSACQMPVKWSFCGGAVAFSGSFFVNNTTVVAGGFFIP